MIAKISSTLFAALTLSGGLAFVYAVPATAQTDLSCIVRLDMMELDGRSSPLDSLTFSVAGERVKICYGRPSARGRTMIGTGSAEGPIEMGQVPYGKIWRTGANEPTLLLTPIDLSIADLHVPAGIYSIYTVPGPTEWEIIVNRSYSQWGMESFYTDEVEAQEVGRVTVASVSTDAHVETFTIRAEETPEHVHVLLEWERTRVLIPIAAARR